MAGTGSSSTIPVHKLSLALPRIYRRVRLEHQEVCELRERILQIERRLVALAACAGLEEDTETMPDPPPVPELEPITDYEKLDWPDELKPKKGTTAHGRWTAVD